MTKKELKSIMEEILANECDHDRDDWYCTSREIAEHGLKLLADKLDIELNEDIKNMAIVNFSEVPYQMTLGELEDRLSKMDPSTVLSPCRGLGSYRGYYDQVCIYSDDGRSMTVAQLLSEVREALAGEVYYGWKGGDYVYDSSTPVWVAPMGCIGDMLVAIDNYCDFVVYPDPDF